MVAHQRMRFHPDRRPIAVIRLFTGRQPDPNAPAYNPFGLTMSGAMYPMVPFNVWDSTEANRESDLDTRFEGLIDRLNELYASPYGFRRFMISRPAGLFPNDLPPPPYSFTDTVPSGCWHVDDSSHIDFPHPEYFDLYRERFEGTTNADRHVAKWLADHADAVLYVYLGFRLSTHTTRRMQSATPAAYRPDLNGLENGRPHLPTLTKNLGVYSANGGWVQLGAPGQVGFFFDNSGSLMGPTPNRDAVLKVIRWVRRRGAYAGGEAVPSDNVGGVNVPRADLLARAPWLAAYDNQTTVDPGGLWLFGSETEVCVQVIPGDLASLDTVLEPARLFHDFHSRGYVLQPTDLDAGENRLVAELTSPLLSWRARSLLPEFTRSGARSYLIRTTDGSAVVAYPRWAVVNEARFEDRAEHEELDEDPGVFSLWSWGRHLVIEGARTNLLLRSEELDSGSWTKTNCTATANAATAPDGEADADALVVTSSGSPAFASQAVTVTSGVPLTFSVWCRSHSNSPATVSIGLSDGTTTVNHDFSPGTTWRRLDVSLVPASTTATALVRIHAASGTGTATQNILFWAAQMETARFPSSYVRTTAATAAATPDVLVFADAPSAMRNGKWRIDVWPYYASSDLVSGDTFVIASFGGSGDVVRIRHDGSQVRVEAVDSGTVMASSVPLTFARHLHVDVLIEVAAMQITVNGVAGTAGMTGWTWPTGSVRIGGIVSGASEAFARLGEPLLVS